MWFQKIYDLGARRVLVTGTGPLGCVPAELAMRSTNGGCSAELQRAAALYNPQLVQMVQGLNSKIGSNVFIAANTALMHNDFISNPLAYGMSFHLRNVNGCPKNINLRNILRNVLWKKKIAIDFFDNFLYFYENNTKIFLKWPINKCLKNTGQITLHCFQPLWLFFWEAINLKGKES